MRTLYLAGQYGAETGRESLHFIQDDAWKGQLAPEMVME
jgi:hypothetical protein